MVVCLTGAHSNGKSTLVEFFRGKEGFECIDSVTRSTISKEERKVDGVENLDEAQLKILDNIEKATLSIVEMNVKDPSKVYLLDRCVFDFLAYTKCFHQRGLVSDECLEHIEKVCKNYWKYYDLVCYLGIEFPIVSDGVRSEDEELRKDVDEAVLDSVLWSEVKAIQLRGPVLTRVNKITKSIEAIRNGDF